MYTHISRCCKDQKILPYIRKIVSRSYQDIPKNELVKFNGKSTFTKQALYNNLKIGNILRGSTVFVRFHSNVSNKCKKAGYWLRTHKGKLFVGLIIGVTIGYYVIFVGICTILDEVIKKTIR